MPARPLIVALVGATGSVGTHVVEEVLRRGHTPRALIRGASQRARFPATVETAVVDITRAETLGAALEVVDAIVFTHGSNGGRAENERVDYGAVRSVLAALGARRPRIALMTAIGVTNHNGRYNRRTEAHDWKRRSERLVRASGLPYTIIRPGWFDYNRADEQRPLLLQGDRRQAGDPSDGAVSRRLIARFLIHSLTSEAARNKTFELVSQLGPEPADFDPLLAALDADASGSLEGAWDMDTLPLDREPDRVRADLATQRARRAALGARS